MNIEDLWYNPTAKHCVIAFGYSAFLGLLSSGDLTGLFSFFILGGAIVLHEIVLVIMGLEERRSNSGDDYGYFFTLFLIPFVAIAAFFIGSNLKEILR